MANLKLLSVTPALAKGIQLLDCTGQVYLLKNYTIHHPINDSLTSIEGRHVAFETGVKWERERQQQMAS